MKGYDTTIYLTEKREKSKSSKAPLFINCIISILSICFAVNIFCFYHVLIGDKLFEKFLLVILSGLALTFIAALRYSFFAFIKLLAEKYKLLLVLGIKTKDFWKLAVNEYFSAVFLLGIKAILFSNAACIAVSCAIFWNNPNVNMIMVLKQYLLTVILVFMIYATILVATMISIIYHNRNNNLIDFFEQFSQDLSRKNRIKNGMWKPVSGLAFQLLSYILLINFRVEKMMIAILFNLTGAFLLIHSDGSLIKKKLKKYKRIYYEKILIWSDMVYQYKINSHLIFILYTLNFFLVYFMGGLIISVNSGQETITKYPYETVIYSDSSIYPRNSYHVLSIDVKGYGSVTAVSNEDYNHLMKTPCNLKKGDVLFLDEREKEADLPISEKEIQVIGKGKDGKYLNYHVENAEWKVMFGQDIFQELNGIVVFNDNDFDFLLKSKAGADRYLFLSNQPVNSPHLKGAEYWNRTQTVEKERMENRVVITLVYMISLILILQGQAYIYTKQINNQKEERYIYDVLQQLGIRPGIWKK